MGERKGWRAFASDFVGASEASFETFQEHKATAVDESPLAGIGLNLHQALCAAGTQAIYDESTREVVKQERMRTLHRKMQEQQRRYQRIEERRKQRDLENMEAWKQHVAEEREKRNAEQQERLAALAEAERQAQEVKAQKQAAKEAAELRRKTEITLHVPEGSTFLTGVEAPAESKTSSNVDTNNATKVPSDVERAHNKTRKPRPPKAHRKKKEEGVITRDPEKSMVQQLPQLFPGLRRTAEGKQIQEEVSAEKASTHSGADAERTLRRAQLSLMQRIANQVLDYRRSVRKQPIRLIEVVPGSSR